VTLTDKKLWKIRASSGKPRFAIDDKYATTWISEPSKKPWLEIDLGEIATLGGLEVYWGTRAAAVYGFESSLEGEVWAHLCSTRHGEGGLDVFAFPSVAARFVRWVFDNPDPEGGQEIVEINLYAPTDATSVVEAGRVAALGHAPVNLAAGESVTIDFGSMRYPLGALIEWGETFGTVFSVHLSDDGESFREVGLAPSTASGDAPDAASCRDSRSRAYSIRDMLASLRNCQRLTSATRRMSCSRVSVVPSQRSLPHAFVQRASAAAESQLGM
jgi:hypothetical protein